MKTKTEWALYHAKRGFYVFRLIPNGKTPYRKGWQVEATRDPAEIEELWSGDHANCNVGGFTSRFMDEGCITVDIDMKGKANGDASLQELVDEGYDFPDTLTQMTPTGGRHLVYRAPFAVKQGAAVLGKGLDIRSRGGFIVMAGSVVPAGEYVSDFDEVAEVPKWLFAKLSSAKEYAARKKMNADAEIDADAAYERGMQYLAERAEQAEVGSRNDTAFKIACQLKDLGNDEDVTYDLLQDQWNQLLDEPLEEEEVMAVIMSAFRYGQNELGSKAVETMFTVREKKDALPTTPKPEEKPEAEKVWSHPFDELNKEFALVVSGGSHLIFHETTDQDGHDTVHHMKEETFHRYHAHKTFVGGDGKTVQLTKAWLTDQRARRYIGVVFEPQRAIDPRYYNLWKGFAVDPQGAWEEPTFEEQRSFEFWLEHVRLNICNGDELQFRWLMAWCADLVQRPWRKPQAAIVLQGRKGTGKNIFAEAIHQLFGSHSMIVEDERHIYGNFNSMIASKKVLISDESIWGGDKKNEGRLKGLITGKAHIVEYKGKEPFPMKNILAMIFMSNNRWVVPATEDERRFYVTRVGDGRRKDRKFFGKIVDVNNKMIGIRLLMRYLLEYDTSEFDVDIAPETQGLVGQKIASLEPFEEWWYDCLMDGSLVGSVAKGIDFAKIHCDTFNRAFSDYVRNRHIRQRMPTADEMRKSLAAIAPSLRREKHRADYFYVSEGLDALRADWENYIGSNLNWENIKETDDAEEE